VAELLGSAAELRTLLDLEEDELPDRRAEELLELVSGAVLAHCGRESFLVTDEPVEALLDGSGSSVMLLRNWPIVDVTVVEEDPRDVYGTTTLEDDVDFEWSADGILTRRNGARWVRRARWYRIEYRFGFEEVPAAVKSVVLRAAARAAVNPEGLVQESLAGYAAGYGGEHRSTALSAVDRAELAPFAL
jgi:hypothetical protein